MPRVDPNWSEQSLRSWLDEVTARAGIPGASLAVRSGDALLQAEAGVLSVESGRRVRSDSVFQIGSTGKVLTAAVLLQLIDQGMLDLDGPIGEHLGRFEIGGVDVSDVTSRQLLSREPHRAGGCRPAREA